MSIAIRRVAAALLLGVVVSTALVATSIETASACALGDPPPCPQPPPPPPPPPPGGLSDGGKDEQITTDTTSCSVYANGGGMGMYCTTFGGGNSKTLRERFGDQKLQQCRYSGLPPTVKAPYSANLDAGRYMLMTCLDNIDFDTYNGGGDRSLSLSVVFVPDGTDAARERGAVAIAAPPGGALRRA